MATKSQLEADNQRLQASIDELNAKIDRLNEPVEDIKFDIEMAFEKFKSSVTKAADELQQELNRLVALRKTPA